jgi:cytochrome c peroxidase
LFTGLPAVALDINGDPHPNCPTTGHDAATVEANLGLAFEAYLLPITSVGSRFDRYVSGEVIDGRTTQRDALTDVERRGLRVFLREGMCIECHGGPLLGDLQFRNTGVKQAGSNVVTTDLGLGGTAFDGVKYPEYDGMFSTQPLRNVARTAPYMHAGQYATLADVIAFYRRGGDPEGTFSGVRDRRLLPLDMTDEQAADLEAFLQTLTGNEPDPALTSELPP